MMFALSTNWFAIQASENCVLIGSLNVNVTMFPDRAVETKVGGVTSCASAFLPRKAQTMRSQILFTVVFSLSPQTPK